MESSGIGRDFNSFQETSLIEAFRFFPEIIFQSFVRSIGNAKIGVDTKKYKNPNQFIVKYLRIEFYNVTYHSGCQKTLNKVTENFDFARINKRLS